MRKTLADKEKHEKQQFNDPKEYQNRVDVKYEELAKKNAPGMHNDMDGGPPRSLRPHELLQMSHTGVKQDHVNTMHGFNTDYHKGVNNVLNRATEDGRGPQSQNHHNEQSRSRDNDRNHERD